MYAPKFRGKNYKIVIDGNPIGLIDNHGDFKVTLSKSLDHFAMVEYRNLSHMLTNESEFVPDFRDRIYGDTFLFRVGKGSRFPLNTEALMQGYDGLAALIPICSQICSDLLAELDPLHETYKPQFLIPAKGLSGDLTIDLRNEEAVVDRTITYRLHMLSVGDESRFLVNRKSADEIINSIQKLSYALVEPITFQEDKNLMVFDRFLKKLG